MKSAAKRQLSPEQQAELLRMLKDRFAKNLNRHKGLDWAKVQARLAANPEKLWSLNEMERTGGEPDVVGHDKATGACLFFDCSAQSPAMGIELLTEEQYYELQKLGEFDTKRSSWLKAPADIRKLGGALFGDRRFGRVFIYHNGAESYYGGRGFRGSLRV